MLHLCIEPNLSFFVNEEEGKCHFEKDEFRKVLERSADLPDSGGRWPSYQEKVIGLALLGFRHLTEDQELLWQSAPTVALFLYIESIFVVENL